MALIRTILALIILVILFHVGATFAGVAASTNNLTKAIYSLGQLLESPASALLNILPLSPGQRSFINQNPFYVTALTAAVGYFILYLLLGIGKRK